MPPLCPDEQVPVSGVCPPGQNIDIHCVPETVGAPTTTPAADQLPFAYDETTGILWVHICDPCRWVGINLGLCRLPETTIAALVVADPCTDVQIPITYDNGSGCQEARVDMGDLAAAIIACAGISGDTVSIILGTAPHTTVTANTVGTVTTFTVDSPPSVMTQVVLAGNVIANHQNGSGIGVDVIETCTTLTLTSPGGAAGFDYINECGITTSYVETISPMVLVAPGPGTVNGLQYTDESGVVVVFVESISPMALTVPGPGTVNGLQYIDESGVVTDYVESISPMTLTAPGPGTVNGLQYVDESGVVTDYVESISPMTLTAPGPGTINGLQYTDESGAVVNYVETLTTVASDGNGGLIYTNEAGVIVPLVSGQLGSLSVATQVVVGNQIGIHNDGAGNITSYEETITTFLPGGGGSFNYTNEAGAVTNLPAGATSVVTPIITFNNPIATHNDGLGNITTIQETITSFFMDPSGSWVYNGELLTTFGQTPRGVHIWREAGGQGAIGATAVASVLHNFILSNDPDANMTPAIGGITINRAGRYLIGVQAGSNFAANIGAVFAPLVYVNGLPNANLPGGGLPYPQNHTFVAAPGIFGTAFVITFLNPGDIVQSGIGVTQAGTYQIAEGFIAYLGG